MPIFEYQCQDCTGIQERVELKPIGLAPFCTKCGGMTEKIVSVAAFHDFHQMMNSTIHRPFVTNNIHPDGQPMEIRSHKELAAACKRFGVNHAAGKESRMG